MSKPIKIILIAFVAVVLVVCAFGGGLVAGRFIPGVQSALAAPGTSTPAVSGNQGGTPADLESLFKPFWEAWTIIHQDFVDQPVEDTKLMEGAINGMMQSLGDPHSTYMDPQTYKDATSE